MSKTSFISIVIMALLVQSCTTDKYETDPCASVSYSSTIRPLINMKCAVSECHVSGFQPGDFTNNEVLKQKVSEGKLQLVIFDTGIMPPVNKLTADEKLLLKCWVENGAQTN